MFQLTKDFWKRKHKQSRLSSGSLSILFQYWLILCRSCRFTRNLYLLLFSVAICKFQHFFTFTIRKDSMITFWYMTQDCMWSYVLLLGIQKALVVKRIIHIPSIKITSNSLFRAQIWQNVEICMLIRSVITNINSLQNFTMFFNLWKDRHKISH